MTDVATRSREAAPRALVLLLALALAATGPSCTDEPAPSRMRVVCTTGMVADVVRRVAGERADVTNLIGEGVDPHLFKPTRSDLLALSGADAIFYSGLLLEGKMTDALVRVARSGKPVFAVTERIDPAYVLEPEGFAGHADPHVWMDVRGWMQAVDVVAEALAATDPDGQPVYAANAADLRAEMERLDAYVEQVIASIPPERRVLVTAHDAFNYFGRAYDIEVRGIQGISTESEAGLADINRLVDLLVDRDVQAVFVETSVADRNVRALIEGARSRDREITVGGELFSDAMGPPGTYEGTYVGMIDHNATTIARALGGSAPERGMQDRLGKDGAP